MASGATFHDPLTMNFRRQTARLIELLPSDSPYSSDLRNARSHSELLQLLSILLAIPAYTATIASLFRPLLFDLCARWLHDGQQRKEKFEALCFLIEVHPELFP